MPYDAIPWHELLRKLRRDRGWTQARAAGEFGVAVNTFGNWERDKHRPRADSRRKIAELLGTTIAELQQGYWTGRAGVVSEVRETEPVYRAEAGLLEDLPLGSIPPRMRDSFERLKRTVSDLYAVGSQQMRIFQELCMDVAQEAGTQEAPKDRR